MDGTLLINANDFGQILLRLGSALLIGGLIGWPRQLAGKPAGLRTHMLVTTTAALLVLMPAQMAAPHPAEPLTYILQGISTGVGFLGAGVILHQSDRNAQITTVKGLTSATEIWVAAALGAAAGCGLWVISLAGTGLMLLILTTAKWLERHIPIHPEADV